MKIDARPPSVTEKAARGTLGEHSIRKILSPKLGEPTMNLDTLLKQKQAGNHRWRYGNLFYSKDWVLYP